MLRRVIAIAALLSPAAFAAFAGCATEPLPQDLCSWLSDTNNCYARFAEDIGERCGEAFVSASDPAKSTTGYFLDRTDLATCIRTAGGQILFDPPLDVSAFPPQQVGITMLDSVGQPCGKATFAGEQTFSVSVAQVDKDDAGIGVSVDDDIVGGTFSISRAAGRERFDVSCSGGLETHNFNALTLAKCPELTPFLPTAVLDSSPGIGGPNVNTAGQNGYVRLRVQYPPADPSAEGAAPTVVQYFHCSIPAPPAPCGDGAQNNDETDVDCGGSCNAKCPEGSKCFDNDDCQSNNCALEAGLKQCKA